MPNPSSTVRTHLAALKLTNFRNYAALSLPFDARSVVLTGPMFRQFDLRLSKRTRLLGRAEFEMAAETLNVFNQANFIPVGIGSGATLGNTIASYEVTALTGTNTSRVIQLVTRINW